MKKKLLTVGAIAVAIAIVVACVAVYAVSTPEYAMKMVLKDVKSSGMEGLRPYLTAEVREKFDKVTALTENKLVGVIVNLLAKKDYIGILKSEMKDVDWQVRDIMKSRKNAEVIIDFNYEDRLIGTVEISLVREKLTWKIDGMEMPVFETINWNNDR